jgi:hypothetical protein
MLGVKLHTHSGGWWWWCIWGGNEMGHGGQKKGVVLNNFVSEIRDVCGWVKSSGCYAEPRYVHITQAADGVSNKLTFFSKINIQVILDVMRIPITRLCIPIARPILLVAFANGGIKERGVQPFKDLSDFI